MSAAKKNKDNEAQLRREQKVMEERSQWQQEFIARQNLMARQMEHRRQMRKVPKAAWIFMAVWGGVFLVAAILFLMSFGEGSSETVNKVISTFKVF